MVETENASIPEICDLHLHDIRISVLEIIFQKPQRTVAAAFTIQIQHIGKKTGIAVSEKLYRGPYRTGRSSELHTDVSGRQHLDEMPEIAGQ